MDLRKPLLKSSTYKNAFSPQGRCVYGQEGVSIYTYRQFCEHIMLLLQSCQHHFAISPLCSV